MNASEEGRTGCMDLRRRLLHPPFVSVGGSLLIAAFASDLMYRQSSLVAWANSSAWLIATGLVLALLAAIAFLIDIATGRGTPISWPDFTLLTVAALVSLVNVVVHSRDAWTSVVPEGIWLSATAAVLLVIEAFRGWTVTAVSLARDGNGE
jgi:uncharacterized membrane protein